MAMQRHLAIPGLINFRDLGAYSATDVAGNQRQIQPGMLFRSGHFHDVSTTAHETLTTLGIEQVFDFRTSHEREKRPSRLDITPAPEYVLLALDPGSGATFQSMTGTASLQKSGLDVSQMEQIMCNMNRSLVIDHADIYRTFLHTLLARKPAVAVIHCASGKDRTGIAAALLLSLLGVDRETVLADYLLTNSCLDVQHHVARAMADFDGKYAGALSEATLTAMYAVKPDYLAAAFAAIDEQWGDTDTYLHAALGMDDAAYRTLQQHYLAP